MQRSKNALYLPALTAYRAQATQRRAAAFCDAPEFVCGTKVQPLTPRTFSMLIVTRSAFVCGGRLGVEDVINYLWLHSKPWTDTSGWFYRLRKKWALRRFRFEMLQPWTKWIGRKPDPERQGAILQLCYSDIREIVDEAFADAPIKSNRPGKPLATLEAFFIHEFSASYGWAPERTRNTPLKQLVQLHRCIRSARGADVGDEKEEQILAEHMEAKQREYEAALKNGKVSVNE